MIGNCSDRNGRTRNAARCAPMYIEPDLSFLSLLQPRSYSPYPDLVKPDVPALPPRCPGLPLTLGSTPPRPPSGGPWTRRTRRTSSAVTRSTRIAGGRGAGGRVPFREEKPPSISLTLTLPPRGRRSRRPRPDEATTRTGDGIGGRDLAVGRRGFGGQPRRGRRPLGQTTMATRKGRGAPSPSISNHPRPTLGRHRTRQNFSSSTTVQSPPDVL